MVLSNEEVVCSNQGTPCMYQHDLELQDQRSRKYFISTANINQGYEKTKLTFIFFQIVFICEEVKIPYL